MKHCTVCGQEKPPEAFYRDRKSKDGRSWRCQTCASAAHRIWRSANRDRVIAYNQAPSNKVRSAIIRGLIPEDQQQEALLRLAGTGYDANGNRGRCECCGKVPNGRPGLSADHDHASGRFRGWICYACNNLVGTLESVRTAMAKNYLEMTNGNSRP